MKELQQIIAPILRYVQCMSFEEEDEQNIQNRGVAVSVCHCICVLYIVLGCYTVEKDS